jgi:hypothetical protein
MRSFLNVLIVSLLVAGVLVLVLQTSPQAQGNGQVGRYQGTAVVMGDDPWPTVLLIDTTNGQVWSRRGDAEAWSDWAPKVR